MLLTAGLNRTTAKVASYKAFWVNLFRSGRLEGASTITQQLAKNLFFSFQRTVGRKFREMLVALHIEARFGKSEILEAYVNQIAFGVGALGIEQASQAFFGKPASRLTLAEAALLAGLPKSPTRYNPYRHFDRAKERQKTVLGRMVAVGAITAAEAEEAFRAPLALRPRSREVPASGGYFLDWVLRDLEDRYGTDVVHHAGLKVCACAACGFPAAKTESIGAGELPRPRFPEWPDVPAPPAAPRTKPGPRPARDR